MLKHKRPVAPIFCTFAIATLVSACGSGGSSTPIATVNGQVVGSFIENARVCMDINKNGQCDANEPTTRSAQDGSYSLPVNVGVDIIADIGVDAFVSEKADFSDRKPVPARFALRSGNALWTTGNTTVSALSTIVSAEIGRAHV